MPNARVDVPWTESGDEGRLSIAFDGIDADRRDAFELDEFRSHLQDPPRQVSGFLPRGSEAVAREPSKAVLAVLSLFCGAVAFVAWGRETLLAAATCLVVLPAALVAVVMLVTWLRQRPAGPGPQRVTVTLEPSGLHIDGHEFSLPLSAIVVFEAGPRLGILTVDGTRRRLPYVLPIAADHAGLAARLNEALPVVRAAAGGYRGPRVEVAAAEDTEESGGGPRAKASG